MGTCIHGVVEVWGNTVWQISYYWVSQKTSIIAVSSHKTALLKGLIMNIGKDKTVNNFIKTWIDIASQLSGSNFWQN